MSRSLLLKKKARKQITVSKMKKKLNPTLYAICQEYLEFDSKKQHDENIVAFV